MSSIRDIAGQMCPAERRARCEQKRERLLSLLADELYISTDLVALALGLKRTAAYQTAASLEKRGLVVRDSISLQGHACTVWGITALGLASAGRDLDQPVYEVGRVSYLAGNHHLTTLRVRIQAENAGWRDWQAGRSLYGKQLPKVPDAIGISPWGETVAFEIELNPKSVKRYRDIVAGHLLAMKAGSWQSVIYLSPQIFSARLERLFASLGHVNVPGLGKAALTEMHLKRFKFCGLEDISL